MKAHTSTTLGGRLINSKATNPETANWPYMASSSEHRGCGEAQGGGEAEGDAKSRQGETGTSDLDDSAQGFARGEESVPAEEHPDGSVREARDPSPPEHLVPDGCLAQFII